MIGLDTNVLVRYLTQDDKQQALAATNLLESGETFFVNLMVLCELVWVLESCYKQKSPEIKQIIQKILSTKQLRIEKSHAVWKALENYEKNSNDFSDCLIGELNNSYECSITYSFDKDTKKLATFKLIS